MSARKKEINLLPLDEFEKSFIGRFLKWALSVGRYIVIGTELVVIGSFLARFTLDRQLTDLNEAIVQKRAVMASYGELEQNARSVQGRLNLIADLTQRQLGSGALLDKTQGFTPVDVAYTLIEYSKEEVNLEGVAFSEAGFRTLLSELRADDSFEKVQVRRVTSEGDESPGIEFSIRLALSNGL